MAQIATAKTDQSAAVATTAAIYPHAADLARDLTGKVQVARYVDVTGALAVAASNKGQQR